MGFRCNETAGMEAIAQVFNTLVAICFQYWVPGVFFTYSFSQLGDRLHPLRLTGISDRSRQNIQVLKTFREKGRSLQQLLSSPIIIRSDDHLTLILIYSNFLIGNLSQ